MRDGRYKARIACRIAMAIFILAAGAETYQKAHATGTRGSIATLGQAAPGFSLADVRTGEQTSLDSLRKDKKATVIMFISTHCPVSNAYNGRMVELANNYASRGVAFVGINANHTETVSDAAEHARENKFSFPVLKDVGNAVADMYDAHVTPETYVVDAGGRLVYHGRIDNNMDESQVHTHDLADALDSVLSGKAVAHAQTKAFGCSIKRVS